MKTQLYTVTVAHQRHLNAVVQRVVHSTDRTKEHAERIVSNWSRYPFERYAPQMLKQSA